MMKRNETICDVDCGGESTFRKILFENFTLGICMCSINCTRMNARTVEDETCCTV
jgi:hypothetical protein